MRVKLVVVNGDVKNSEIRLKIPAIVGRGRGASLQIPQALVSRQHCELLAIDGKLRVRDLGSLNGTLVDGKKVTEAEVSSGQTLTIGSVTFRVEYGESVESVPCDEGSKPPENEKQVTTAAPPAAVESPIGPKTDELFVNVNAEIAAILKGPAETDESEPVEFTVDESHADESLDDEPLAAFLPPVANSIPTPAATPRPVALPPTSLPPANVSPPQPAPLAIPVAIPVAAPPPPAPPASESPPKPADDDDDDLRAFLQSLGK